MIIIPFTLFIVSLPCQRLKFATHHIQYKHKSIHENTTFICSVPFTERHILCVLKFKGTKL